MSVLTTARTEELAGSLDARCQKHLDIGYEEIYRGPSMYGGEMVLLYRHPNDRPDYGRPVKAIKGQVLCFTVVTTHHGSCRHLSANKTSVREICNMMADGGSPQKLIITEWGSPLIAARAAREPAVHRTDPVLPGALISSIGKYTNPTHRVVACRSGIVKMKRIEKRVHKGGYEVSGATTEVPLALFDSMFKVYELQA